MTSRPKLYKTCDVESAEWRGQWYESFWHLLRIYWVVSRKTDIEKKQKRPMRRNNANIANFNTPPLIFHCEVTLGCWNPEWKPSLLLRKMLDIDLATCLRDFKFK